MEMNYPNTKLLINGKWRDAADGKTMPVIDPALGEVIGTVASASKADLEEVASSIARGFEVWREVMPLERSKIMRKAAGLLRERADKIAWVLTREQGKPFTQAKSEVMGAADTIEWFAGEALRAYGQIIPPRSGNITQMVIKRPVGPVAVFTPWNFPLNQVVRKLSAGLAAGCSMVVKGPDETPASPAALMQCFLDAGLPSNVIALVYGVPSEISEFFIPHPVIQKISFTGSTAVGKQLAALAGQYMKKSTMELGGHAPVLIFDDADIGKAVAIIADAKIRNGGQVCTSPTRFLIQDAVYDEFLIKYTEALKAVKVGNGLDKATTMGPLANERRIPALEAMIKDAVDKGAKLALGGSRIGNKGYFFEPTILTDVPVNAKIMNDEPFGPISLINRFKNDDEAFVEANRLNYGLASYAFAASAARVMRLVNEVNAGMTTINHNGLALQEVPFGGIKDSGYGTEGGSDAINAYFDQKFATFAV